MTIVTSVGPVPGNRFNSDPLQKTKRQCSFNAGAGIAPHGAEEHDQSNSFFVFFVRFVVESLVGIWSLGIGIWDLGFPNESSRR